MKAALNNEGRDDGAYPPRVRQLDLVLTSLVSATLLLGLGLIAPALPLFGAAFSVDTVALGLLVAAFPAGRLALSYVAGTVADRYGFRRLGVIGCLISALASGGASLASNLYLLIAMQFLVGCGSAIYTSAAASYVVNRTSPNRIGRALAYYQTAVLVGTALGPTLGAIIVSALGLRMPFVIYAGLCLVGVVITLLAVVPRSTQQQYAKDVASAPDGPIAIAIPVGPQRRVYALLMLAVTILFWVRTGHVNTLVPLYAYDELGMPITTIGYVLTIAVLTTVAIVPLAGFLADRGHGRHMHIFGAIALGSTVAALAVTSSTMSVSIVLAVFGLCTGIVLIAPQVMFARWTHLTDQGRAVGIHRTAASVGMMAGPATIGFLAEHWAAPAIFAASGAAIVAVGAIMALLPRRTPVDYM